MNPEAMLLIDDYQRQVPEIDTLLKQGMCSNHDVAFADRRTLAHLLARLAFFATRQDIDVDPRAGRQPHRRREMLTGQNFGRHHERTLCARLDGGGQGEQRDHGLA